MGSEKELQQIRPVPIQDIKYLNYCLPAQFLAEAQHEDLTKSALQPIIERDPKIIKDNFKELAQMVKQRHNSIIDEIKILELINENSCSKLYKVFDKANNRIVYLKVLEVNDEQDNSDAYNEINIYLKIMRKNDPLLLDIYGAELKSEKDDKSHKFYLLLEGGRGSLKDLSLYRMSKGVQWLEKELLDILKQTVIQIHRLLDMNLFCRDIKPEHLILTSRGIKVLEFAQACSRPTGVTKLDIAGSPWFMAPELAEAHKQMQKRLEYNPIYTESYSIGMTILKLLGPKIEDKVKLAWILDRDYPHVSEHVKEMIVEDEARRKTFVTIYVGLGLESLARELEKAEDDSKIKDDHIQQEFVEYVKKNSPKKAKANELLSLLIIYNTLNQYYEFTSILEELKPDGSKYDDLKAKDKVKLHELIAKNAMGIGDEKRALANYFKVLENQIIAYTREHATVAMTYLIIGGIYLKLEDYEKAIEFYKYSLEVREKINMPNDNAKGVLLFDMGSAYEKLGSVDKASECYQQAIQVFEELHGRNHPAVATGYNYLGGTQEVRGLYKDALNSFKNALDIRIAICPPGHPTIGVSYNNLGIVYERLAEYKKAREMYQKAYEIWHKAYGNENERVATALNNIGSAYDNLKEYKKAEEYYKKSLEIRVDLFGENHKSVAQSYNNIGTVHYFLQNYDKAIENYNKCLKIWISEYGESHPKVATVYSNMATVYRILKRNDQAKEYFEKCLDIKTKVYGNEHPSVAATLVNLGEITFLMNEKEKALEFFEKAYEIRTKVLGPQHPASKELDNILYKFRKSVVLKK